MPSKKLYKITRVSCKTTAKKSENGMCFGQNDPFVNKEKRLQRKKEKIRRTEINIVVRNNVKY